MVIVCAPSPRLLVSETSFDDDTTGPSPPVMSSLLLLVGFHGDDFSAAGLREAIEDVGLRDVQVCRNDARGLRDLVVAQRR